MSIWLKPDEYMPKGNSLLEGETIHINHADCEAGIDTRHRLYISNKEGVIVAYCHHCSKKGASTRTHVATVDELRKFPMSKMTKHLAPIDLYGEPIEKRVSSPEVRATVASYTLNMSLLNSLGYRVDGTRLIIPLHDNNTIYGYQTKYCQNGASIRYSTHLLVDKPIPYVYKSNKVQTNKVLFIVEDPTSCYTIVQAGGDALALLGTTINNRTTVEILNRYQHVVIWLDNDTPGLRATHILEQRLAPLLNSCISITHEQLTEPKRTAMSELKAIINGMETVCTM